ncbi:F-box protein CPR30-like [Chenopodium quinoa]|uniref:F-box protein CPR30-like n=1 Tax=Chenopodium quinoa TaxID=63459 RepID=UPI000B79812A|nr:F-box protein CPR30-like [Chenopodium quinoa]
MVKKSYLSLELAIPEDIIIPHILMKLPVRSLLCLKCVSKYFKTLISSPEFINFHLRTLNSSSDDEKLYILQSYYHCLYSLDSTSLSSSSPVERLKLRYPQKQGGRSVIYYKLIGSCNGLHCVQSDEGFYLDYVVFNPSTGVYKKIGFHFVDIDLPINGLFLVHSGFGFDNVSNDYKIVMLVSTCCGSNPSSCQIFVYSLMANSWRALDIHFNYYQSLKNDPAAVIDKHLFHFLFNEGVVGCFDIQTEQWSKFELPTFINRDDKLFWELGVFEGCLYIMVHDLVAVEFLDFDTNYEVWVMKEYKVKESWSKITSVWNQELWPKERKFINDSISPLKYSDKLRDDQILFWNEYNSTFIYYNIESKLPNIVEINGVVSTESKAYFCHETLVTIPGGKQLRGVLRK